MSLAHLLVDQINNIFNGFAGRQAIFIQFMAYACMCGGECECESTTTMTMLVASVFGDDCEL